MHGSLVQADRSLPQQLSFPGLELGPSFVFSGCLLDACS